MTISIYGDWINADFNGDNLVDAADYIVWRTNNGTPVEYRAWQVQFGRELPPQATLVASHSVPEPKTWTLLLGIVLLGWSMRHVV